MNELIFTTTLQHVTHGWTDKRMDAPMDRRTDGLVKISHNDAWMHPKIVIRASLREGALE